MPNSKENIDVLYSREQIADRVKELGKEITETYPHTEELVLVGILKGSVIFFSDLIREIDLTVRCEFMGISSYGSDTKSSGVVKITSDLTAPIEGKDVLIVEDIVDTGLTLDYLLHNIGVRKPASIAVASLLDKPSRRQVQVQVDYVGFSIPDAFVVGFGLDLDERFRQWPDIRIYKSE